VQTIPTDARSLSRRRAAYSVAVAIVFLAYFGACFHGIANYWQWGHNGYNGAAFSNGARNSPRFGVVGQAIYYQGTEPPKAQHMATSHPQMLHYHLVGSYALFGFHEWAGRLVPAFYSVLTLALLFHVARRLWGPAVALVGITVYALTPMHLVFANMIDHEQGGIFWTLCLVWFYVCWFQSLRRRYLLLCLVAVTMAMQFDWPAYYVAFFVAVHALIAGLARRPGWLRWRPEYTFVVVFSIVVLANFGGFFAWIAATRGGLSEMVTSFRGRTGSPPDYASFVWMFTRDLRGYVAVGLLAAWLGVFVTRVVRRRAQVRDLVPSAFVFAQLISSLVFKDAGRVHSYWTYYLGPAIALGGADALVTFARLWVGAAKRWPKVPRFAPALMVLLVGAPLFAHQARFAWVQLGWGFAFGSGAYIQPYTDQFEEIMWVKEVAKRFDRTSVH
jgi:4-amino-4-deoxy-L-arabinose transferase-like glycosyltransferase